MDFLSSLGFHRIAYNLVTVFFSIFFKANDPDKYLQYTYDNVMQCYDSEIVNEIRYTLICILLSQSNEHSNVCLSLKYVKICDAVEETKRKFAFLADLSCKQFDTFSKVEIITLKNVINYFNERSKLMHLTGKFEQSLQDVNKSTSLLLRILRGYHKHMRKMETGQWKLWEKQPDDTFIVVSGVSPIAFPSQLYKLYIDCLLIKIHHYMIQNDFKTCNKLFTTCFSCARTYFKNENHIYSMIFIELGSYMMYKKNFSIASYAFIIAHTTLRNVYAS